MSDGFLEGLKESIEKNKKYGDEYLKLWREEMMRQVMFNKKSDGPYDLNGRDLYHGACDG